MIALITGATSGIGKSTALLFARNGWDVIITGRRPDRLKDLASHVEKETGRKALRLEFDIRERKAVSGAIDGLPAEWREIDVLVNNAGLASGLSLIQEGDPDDWEKMIDTNVKGLLYISRAVMPLMIARGKGHIVNIGSIAGKEAYRKGNVYCSTKFAVDALSRSMRIDLLEHGIRVTSVNPGAAETEFSLVRFKGDESRAKKTYQGYDPLTADDVADVVYYAATRPAHVCLNDITMTPTAQASPAYMYKKEG